MDMVVRPPLSGSTGPVGSEFDLPALPGGPEAIPGVIRFLRFTVDDLSKADLSVDAPETRAGGLDDKLEVCLFHLEQLVKATSTWHHGRETFLLSGRGVRHTHPLRIAVAQRFRKHRHRSLHMRGVHVSQSK